MPKWSGVIGYQNVTEHAPGIWSNEDDVVEKPYRGDLRRKSYHLESTSDINNSIRLNNEISIIGDQYAMDNVGNMLYITVKGSKWYISSVDASNRPRLIVTLGGIYK